MNSPSAYNMLMILDLRFLSFIGLKLNKYKQVILNFSVHLTLPV